MPDAPAANRFPVSFDGQTLLRLCQTYRVAELSLFGSVTRDDFDQARSDVDVLVEFLPDTPVSGWVWFERYSLFTLEEALEEMFHRQVDLLDKKEIDPYVRDEVLGSRVVVYRSSPGLLREPGALYDGSPGGNAPAGAPGTDAPGGGGTDSQTVADQKPEGGTVRKPPGPLGPEKAKATLEARPVPLPYAR